MSDQPKVAENAALHERVVLRWADLTKSERIAAEFMSSNPAKIALCSAAELGRLTQTSDATVIRAVRKLGYGSLYDLRQALLSRPTPWRDPSHVLGGQLSRLSRTVPEYEQVLEDTIQQLNAMRGQMDPDSWRLAVETLHGSGTVHTYGLGSSSVLAEYLGLSLRRMGLTASVITASGIALADDLLQIRPGHCLVIFPTLRRLREVDAAIEHARSVGASVIAITETQGAAIRNRVDVVMSTPQATTTTTSGVVLGMVMVRGLEMAVAARLGPAAVAALGEMNAVRAAIIGGQVDSDGPTHPSVPIQHK